MTPTSRYMERWVLDGFGSTARQLPGRPPPAISWTLAAWSWNFYRCNGRSAPPETSRERLRFQCGMGMLLGCYQGGGDGVRRCLGWTGSPFPTPTGPAHQLFVRLLCGGKGASQASAKVGHSYELILTTRGGLCRYRIGDVVRIAGKVGQMPLVELQGRAGKCFKLCDWATAPGHDAPNK